jgi:NADPH-dependent 2,4-dienoyl-CoA reductase/sulfur reductase-like enzyme
MPRLLVIGGMGAGMSAASKLRRLRPEWEATVLEAGEDLSYGACGLPYWVGGVAREMSDLYALDEEEIARRGIEVKLRQRATSLLEGKKKILVEDVPSGRVREESYDALVIAAGARAALPSLRGLEGENLFTLHDLGDGCRLYRFIQEKRPRSALIWGTGYVGLEMAENLAARGVDVTLINRSERVLRSLVPELRDRVLRELEFRGVRVSLGTQVQEVLRSGESIRALRTDRGELAADLFLVATGVRPATDFLADSPVSLAANGAIRVDETCATGVHGIWAAGDCCEVTHLVSGRPAYVPLGTTANKMGRVAGSCIAGERERFPGIVGTAITRAFSLEVGVTGFSPAEAKEAGFDPLQCVIEAGSRAGYYPGGGSVLVQLTADRRGRLLGGQVAGPEGVKGRVDTLAAAVTAGMKIDDFAMLDLAYAPPFAPVWDPLLVAAGVLKGRVKSQK